jgi:hypothetical protein
MFISRGIVAFRKISNGSNVSNTPNDSNKASEKVRPVPRTDPKSHNGGDTKTFQLLEFPADLLGRVNATAEYLGVERKEFVVEILEEVMEDLDVQRLRQTLKDKWTARQKRRKSRKDAQTAME